MVFRNFLTASVLSLSVMGCQTTGGSSAPEPVVGSTYSGLFTDGGNQVPLPDGTWTVMGRARSENDFVRYNDTVLATDVSGIIAQVVIVRNAYPAHIRSFKPYAYCDDPAYVHAVTVSNEFRGKQDCWRTMTWQFGGSGTPEHVAQFQQEAGMSAKLVPPVMIGVGYHVAEGTDALDVFYLWNPDLFMPNTEPGQTWGWRDWQVGDVVSDPRKQAAFDILRGWAEEWHATLWKGFRNGLPATGAGS